jgi:hypothetical protein
VAVDRSGKSAAGWNALSAMVRGRPAAIDTAARRPGPSGKS